MDTELKLKEWWVYERNIPPDDEWAAGEIKRLRAALQELRQELWNDGDGGPRYSGYLAIIDAALVEAEP